MAAQAALRRRLPPLPEEGEGPAGPSPTVAGAGTPLLFRRERGFLEGFPLEAFGFPLPRALVSTAFFPDLDLDDLGLDGLGLPWPGLLDLLLGADFSKPRSLLSCLAWPALLKGWESYNIVANDPWDISNIANYGSWSLACTETQKGSGLNT